MSLDYALSQLLHRNGFRRVQNLEAKQIGAKIELLAACSSEVGSWRFLVEKTARIPFFVVHWDLGIILVVASFEEAYVGGTRDEVFAALKAHPAWRQFDDHSRTRTHSV